MGGIDRFFRVCSHHDHNWDCCLAYRFTNLIYRCLAFFCFESGLKDIEKWNHPQLSRNETFHSCQLAGRTINKSAWQIITTARCLYTFPKPFCSSNHRSISMPTTPRPNLKRPSVSVSYPQSNEKVSHKVFHASNNLRTFRLQAINLADPPCPASVPFSTMYQQPQ